MAPTQPLSAQWTRVRRALAEALRAPGLEGFILVMILASVGLLIIELVLPLGHPALPMVIALGDGLTAAFVVELSLRWVAAHQTRRFLRRYWIDLLAVLPVFRPFRLFRVLRVLRVLRASHLFGRRLLPQPLLGGSAGQITSILAVTVVLVVGSASVLHMVEVGSGSGLQTYEDALWFALFSVIAGEPIGADPATEVGRMASLVLMLGGLTVFGVFVGVVSADVSARLAAGFQEPDMDLDELSHHVLILGWNGSGPSLLSELTHGPTGNRSHLVLITEGPRPEDLPVSVLSHPRFAHLQADYTKVEVLESVAVTSARKAIVLTDQQTPRSDQDKDARVVLAALTLERLAPELYTVVEVTSRETVPLLRMAGVEEIVVGDWYAGVIMGSAAHNRGLVNVLEEVLTNAHGNTFYSVSLPEALEGITVADLHERLFREHHATLISVESAEGRLEVNPPRNRTLTAGERLVVLSEGVPTWSGRV